MNYEKKYIKYKIKYMNLKIQSGGIDLCNESEYMGGIRRIKGGSSSITQLNEPRKNVLILGGYLYSFNDRENFVQISDKPNGLLNTVNYWRTKYDLREWDITIQDMKKVDQQDFDNFKYIQSNFKDKVNDDIEYDLIVFDYGTQLHFINNCNYECLCENFLKRLKIGGQLNFFNNMFYLEMPKTSNYNIENYIKKEEILKSLDIAVSTFMTIAIEEVLGNKETITYNNLHNNYKKNEWTHEETVKYFTHFYKILTKYAQYRKITNYKNEMDERVLHELNDIKNKIINTYPNNYYELFKDIILEFKNNYLNSDSQIRHLQYYLDISKCIYNSKHEYKVIDLESKSVGIKRIK